MYYYTTIGIVLGLSAGFAPGPLLTLVISETLEHDIKSGIKVALAPIITDLPIVVLTLLLFSQLNSFHLILGTISMLGGFFILSIGIKNLRSKGLVINSQKSKPKSLLKGVLANALSPHPYLFWLSVGAPIMSEASMVSIYEPIAFILMFYLFLVGSKVVLAFLAGQSKLFLSSSVYLYIIRFLGLALIILAFILFIDSLTLLKIIEAGCI